MAEDLSQSYYLPIPGGRRIGFIPFPRVLVLCEMQSVSSRIWTRVDLSISYDDSHYTTGTSTFFYHVCYTKAKESSRPYLPLTVERTNWLNPLSRALKWSETTPPDPWSIDSISFSGNHNAKLSFNDRCHSNKMGHSVSS